MASHILARTDDTCGDPATAQPFQEWYQSPDVVHWIGFRPSVVGDNGNDWQFQGTIALAWPTQEPGTVPLYSLFNPTTVDFIFLTPDSNGNPPTFPGATLGSPVFFVYPTQICGSVPLYAVFNSAQGDHFYTTYLWERNDLIEMGWGTDAGIVAYVLPLSE
ncbi:hypothetical protein M422DRAFT_263859 [Sphaerobolus stellatus SS14]|uniref:DUF5648 domain-containing protein n=1 Tax=Sphaerobolus stellatus (strain SS14) TaxID=990650 RepID=A0A0C9UXP7_SPHS4|nr:hypothetical protein M422DRAFT_263859 [Sphaerobolus stellatus SS14]